MASLISKPVRCCAGHAKDMHARIVADEFGAGGEAAKRDPRFVEACARRGITDMDTVLVEAWAAGHFGIAEEDGQRIAYGHCWVRNDSGDNPYAKPIANLPTRSSTCAT